MEATQNLRARQANVLSTFTAIEWVQMVKDSDHKCMCCRTYGSVASTYEHKQLVPDHVIPLSWKGTNTADNIQVLCVGCNTRKRGTAADYRSVSFREKYSRFQFVDIPVSVSDAITHDESVNVEVQPPDKR